jgi:hypothetical protein
VGSNHMGAASSRGWVAVSYTNSYPYTRRSEPPNLTTLKSDKSLPGLGQIVNCPGSSCGFRLLLSVDADLQGNIKNLKIKREEEIIFI